MKAMIAFGITSGLAALAARFARGPNKAQARQSDCDSDDLEQALYTSDLAYTARVIDEISLFDSGHDNYEIKLLVRYPEGAVGPCPVVIWHHGGHPSGRGNTRSEEWGTLLAEAGYVVIHPSRTMISNPIPYEAECRSNGIDTPDDCAYWVTQARLGPQITHYLIEHLSDVEALDPALAGMLDTSKIAVAGHSAGTTAVLANSGAWQQWLPNGPQYCERNDVPIAFLATGVQGPMFAGFKTGFQGTAAFDPRALSSYSGIDRPFMFITGVGDETGEPPEARTTAWLTSLPGNKALVWDTNPEAVHETMDIDKCNTDVRADHCRWIGSAGLAFLDAVVRRRPEAVEWMRSRSLENVSGGEIELHRR